MAIKTMQDLFMHELKDMYYAETHLVKALHQMANETTLPEVKEAFVEHKKETQEQVKRLERVFSMFGKNARPVKCDGMAGLIEEKKSFAKEKPPKDINDFYNIGAGIKVERYEISAYENLVHISRVHLDMEEAAKLLEISLEEERIALATLQGFLEEHSEADMMPEAIPA